MEEFFDKDGKLSRDFMLVSSWTIYHRAFRSVVDWVVFSTSMAFAIYLAVLKYCFTFFWDSIIGAFSQRSRIKKEPRPADETVPAPRPANETVQKDKMDNTKKESPTTVSEIPPPSSFKYETSDEDVIDQPKAVSGMKDVEQVQLQDSSEKSNGSAMIQSTPKIETSIAEDEPKEELSGSAEKSDQVHMPKNATLLPVAGKTEPNLDASVEKTIELESANEKQITVQPRSDADFKDSDNTTSNKGAIPKGSKGILPAGKKDLEKEVNQSDTGNIDKLKQETVAKSPVKAAELKTSPQPKTPESKVSEVSKSPSAKGEQDKTISEAKPGNGKTEESGKAASESKPADPSMQETTSKQKG